MYGYPAYERSSHRAGMADLRMRLTQEQASTCERQNEVLKISLGKTSLGKTALEKHPLETKDPSGGTTGRVKLYGRWGGWALAPDTASLGRDYRSHISWSWVAGETFKAPANFFNFLAGFARGKLSRSGGMIGIAGC